MKNINEIIGFTTEFENDYKQVVHHLVNMLKKLYPECKQKIMFTEEQWNDFVLLFEGGWISGMDVKRFRENPLEDGPVIIFGAQIVSTTSDKFYIFVEKENS